MADPPKQEKRNSFGKATMKLAKRASREFGFEKIQRILEPSLEAGDGKSKLEYSIEQKLSSKAFKRTTGVLLFTVIGVVLLLVGVGYIGHQIIAGRFVRHNHSEFMEFVPSNGSTSLGSLQVDFMKKSKPYRLVKKEEVECGDLTVPILFLGTHSKRMVEDERLNQEGVMMMVRLDELDRSLTQYCQSIDCVCLSAPHIGVPVRIIYTPLTGMMINPAFTKIGRHISDAEYDSPLGEMKLKLPLLLHMDYISSWGEKGKRRARKILTDSTAACVYAANLEFGEENESIPST